MSKTKRKILSLPADYHGNLFIDVVDETAAKHRKVRHLVPTKLKPYRKSSLDHKDRPADKGAFGQHRRTGRGEKLSRDRVNRSYKKGLRQQYKKEIIQAIEN